MLFVIRCRDGEATQPLRQRHLGEHLAHVEQNMARFRVAGPLKDAVGAVVGSLLVIEATGEADAREFLESDPYFDAGVWESIEVLQFLAVAGQWVGGAAWKN